MAQDCRSLGELLSYVRFEGHTYYVYVVAWCLSQFVTSIFVFQVDFALVMMAAGLYKFVAGYRQGEGMELGMVNPEWGYWAAFWGRFSPAHPLFRFFNEMAWGTEVVAATLMLLPPTRFLGGAIMLLSFIFIGSQIRLGFLCEMVMVCCCIFFQPGSAGDLLIKPGSNVLGN